jgi:hypothetical protein
VERRSARLLALVALCAAPAALAGGAADDKWEGTWSVDPGAFASSLVFRPSAAAATRTQAGPCDGPGPRTYYSGSYAGRRQGVLAACAGGYTLSGRLYEGGQAVGEFSIGWEPAVAPDGTVGPPGFSGIYSFGATHGLWTGVFVRHGAGTPPPNPPVRPKPKPPAAGAAAATALVEAMLRKNKAVCRMTWKRITTARSGRLWIVAYNVTTFGHPGRASWEVVGRKIVPSSQLAAEIMNGCK